MVLVHDGPSFAEPHDATIVHRSKINPLHVWKRDDPFFGDAVKQAKADGITLEADSKVIRDGDKVRVYMTSSAPAYGLTDFTVKLFVGDDALFPRTGSASTTTASTWRSIRNRHPRSHSPRTDQASIGTIAAGSAMPCTWRCRGV